MDTVADDAPIADLPPDVIAPAPARSSSPLRDLQRSEEADIKSWIDSLAGEAPVKVTIRRKKPVAGPNGEKIDGVLETVEDRIDEEYLREMWGGGDYLVQVNLLQRDGKYKYFKGRTISIAGPPKMNGTLLVRGGDTPTQTISAGDDSLTERAFNTVSRLAEEERKRADRIAAESRNNGIDVAALHALNGPLIEQLRAAQETVAMLQNQVISLSTKAPPRDEFRDQLLQRALGDENRAVETLRTMYEARIEKMRDNFDDERKRLEDRHQAEVKRLEDRHADEIRRMESAHEREIRSLEKQNEQSGKNLEVANTTRVESLNAEKARLERELAAAQTRIATLEAKKDQTIGEKADELIKVKEALEGLGGGGDSDSPWYEKVLDTLGNSEAAVNLINKIGGGPGNEQQAQQQQLPPPGVPFHGPDGQIYVRDAAGNIGLVDQRALAAMRQQRALAGARARRAQQRSAAGGAPAAQPEAAPAAAPAPGRRPKASEVKLAVKFMENALNSPNTTPETFARGARNLVPSDVLAFIQRVGIDAFLNQVVEPGSPLTTIRGRQFARAVAQILVQGEAAPVEAPAEEEPTDLEPSDDGLDDMGEDEAPEDVEG